MMLGEERVGAWRPRWRMQPRCGLSGVVRAGRGGEGPGAKL